jgi:hypothetical protein
MNERIKELAEQVGFGWDDKYHWYVGSRQMEKFAELIVRECAEICLDMAAKCAGVNDGALAKDCAHWIKQDFGIEE